MEVPEVIPVITPLAEPIVAFALFKDHVPPVIASLKVVVEPTQTLVVPVIDDGNGLIVIVVVDLQPDAKE